MKQFITAALFTISMMGYAQKQIAVTKNAETISNITNHSFSVVIPETKLKDVENNWQKYTSKGSKGKASIVNGEYLQTDVENQNISAYPFNITSRLIETNDGVQLNASINQNNNAFVAKDLNSGVEQAVEKYLRDFAVQEYREVVKEELNREEKKLEQLEKDYASSINNEEKSGKKISSNDRSNVRSNDAIATNQSDIKSSNDKIENQKAMVELNSGDKNAKKGAKKTLKELEKDKKNLQKNNDVREKRIENRDIENRDYERNIISAQQNQVDSNVAIEKQKLVVADLKVKLANII